MKYAWHAADIGRILDKVTAIQHLRIQHSNALYNCTRVHIKDIMWLETSLKRPKILLIRLLIRSCSNLSMMKVPRCCPIIRPIMLMLFKFYNDIETAAEVHFRFWVSSKWGGDCSVLIKRFSPGLLDESSTIICLCKVLARLFERLSDINIKLDFIHINLVSDFTE